eukprot:7247217-Alexandrium_andersonii.AAC.1
MGESTLTGRLGAPLRGAPSCRETSSSPKVRRLFGGGSAGVPVSFCGGGSALAHRATRPSWRGRCTD